MHTHQSLRLQVEALISRHECLKSNCVGDTACGGTLRLQDGTMTWVSGGRAPAAIVTMTGGGGDYARTTVKITGELDPRELVEYAATARRLEQWFNLPTTQGAFARLALAEAAYEDAEGEFHAGICEAAE